MKKVIEMRKSDTTIEIEPNKAWNSKVIMVLDKEN